MTVIGPITMEIVGWQSIETRLDLAPNALGYGAIAQVLVDGQLIRGCSAYTVNIPARGILSATLTLSPAVERASDQVLELLQRWGAVKVDR